jgi:hypothetical protein
MSWKRGKRRHDIDAARFVAALCCEFSACELGRLCGVSDRTVRRWRNGVDWPTSQALMKLVDNLFPQSQGNGPVYSSDMALDGNTRVGGVGEFSIRAAKGDIEYVAEASRS